MIEEDAELLRRYARDRSQAAFTELVRRHINLVYSVALRQLAGDTHLAEDAVQKVFSALALKAAQLDDRAVLAGWLYRSAQFEASKLVRTEQRRRQREKEASLMEEITHDPTVPTDWDKLRPLLDQTLAELGANERDALVLRFLEGRPFAEIGARLQVTENAARMRVDRALDKLHALLARRGVTSTTAALGVAMAGQAALAAPSGLAVSVSGIAVSGAAAAAGSAGLITFLAMNKLPIGFTSALAVASAGGLLVQQQASAQMQRELAQLQTQNQQIVSLQEENRQLSRNATEVAQLRQDDVELARLQQEIGAVTSKLSDQAKARAAAAAAKRARELEVQNQLAVNPANELKSMDQAPRPVYQAKPVYPFEMRKAGIPGQVVISIVVGSNGEVVNPTVVSSTQREFEAAALEAVSRWKFDPGVKGGRKVNTRMQIPVVFNVSNAQGEAGPAKLQSENGNEVGKWF